MYIEQFKNNNFTNAENEIIAFIMKYPNIVVDLSLEELAKSCFVSQASIIRFCKKLGAKGFSDFKIQMARELHSFIEKERDISVDTPLEKNASISDIMETFYSLSEQSLKRTKENINKLDLSKAAHMIAAADIVHLYGRGESLILAEDFQYKLMRIGKNAHLEPLNGFNENHNYEDSKIKKCAVVITQYCNSTQIHYVLDELVNSRIPIVLITAAKDIWPYNTLASIVFQIPCQETRVKIGCFSSRTSFLYLLDCLYGAVFEIYYDKNIDFIAQCAQRKENRNYYYRKLNSQKD